VTPLIRRVVRLSRASSAIVGAATRVEPSCCSSGGCVGSLYLANNGHADRQNPLHRRRVPFVIAFVLRLSTAGRGVGDALVAFT
jgi:hypothetical protein